MQTKEHIMPKVTVRHGKLSIPADMRERVGVHDGDELEVSSEAGRIVLTPLAEEPLPAELEALDEAEAEFGRGQTRRLSDVLHGLGGKTE
jgi:AbrB family looped-hinge helix DNA binding protein